MWIIAQGNRTFFCLGCIIETHELGVIWSPDDLWQVGPLVSSAPYGIQGYEWEDIISLGFGLNFNDLSYFWQVMLSNKVLGKISGIDLGL